MDPTSVLPRTAAPEVALREALDALARGAPVAIATVIERRGSSPATPGQKLALALDRPAGAVTLAVGTVGGGAVEQAVVRLMLESLRAPAPPAPKVHTFRLGPSLGMCCGGAADILVEVLSPPLGAVVYGAGHVGLETAHLLAHLGFAVTLADAREGAIEAARTERARASGVITMLAEHDDPELGAIPPATSALLVMTHDHQLDQRVLEWGLTRGFAFVGGVGSRAKAERTRQRLEARGFSAEDIARVRMPIGVPIGARRPAEIAVAIAAELVSFRAAREGLVRSAPEPVPEGSP